MRKRVSDRISFQSFRQIWIKDIYHISLIIGFIVYISKELLRLSKMIEENKGKSCLRITALRGYSF